MPRYLGPFWGRNLMHGSMFSPPPLFMPCYRNLIWSVGAHQGTSKIPNPHENNCVVEFAFDHILSSQEPFRMVMSAMRAALLELEMHGVYA